MSLSRCSTRIFQNRNTLLKLPRRHGYIVLVPEIGEDSSEKNPLIQKDGLPEFNNITIENCMAAIGKQTLEFESDIKKIEIEVSSLENPDSFKNVIDPIEKLGSPLDMTWGLSKTLYLGNSTLMPTKSYLAIHERARRARAVKFNSPIIYNVILKELESRKDLNDEQTRVAKKFALEERSKFKIKNETATRKFTHKINDPQVVSGLPNDLLKSITSNSNHLQTGPWTVSLQPHVCIPFMEYCPDREIRWNIWQAMVSRGSGYGEKELETGSNIEEIRFLRRDQAKILGYKTFADISMETKMAGSVENVMDMLETLRTYAKPAQDAELESIYAFALESGFEGARMELWDVPYWRRKQRIAAFDFNEKSFQEYFPLPTVLNGLFELCERLFDITIKQRTGVSAWHKDVRFYDIFESHSSAPVAGFYLDPYARTEDKIQTANNGWMVGIQNHSRIADTRPLAALIFNFEPPTAEAPTLLRFRDVSLLFHKFGHALQHLLSRTDYSEVSGLSNIEWDAVEVCGHVLAHWLQNESTYKLISSHYKSEDRLPTRMFEALMNVHRHTAGLELSKELYLSALDMELHTTKTFWLDIVKKLWPTYRSFPLSKIDSHPCSFTQIFTEEWAAAYYSHIWSRVIAADIYSAFHEVRDNEEQILEVAKRFRHTFLALGGGCHPSEVFRQFRGRDPSPKALLSSLGLRKKVNVT
ncbi:hypothetical protein Trydic_g2800 [Trypoxylus dichotomus]